MIDHKKIRFDDPDWVRRMAELEDRCDSVSVGGLAVDVGFYRQGGAKEPAESIAREALGLLIVFTRRKLGLTAAKFAERADLDLVALHQLEHGRLVALDPRTVAHLASALSVSVSRLADLAGLTKQSDPGLRAAAIRFAANAEPLQGLSSEERAALNDFVRELSDRPGGSECRPHP
jgi:transcriptional regulator with XRE-family HTH domain